VLEVKARFYEALQATNAATGEGDNLIVLDEGRQSSVNLGIRTVMFGTSVPFMSHKAWKVCLPFLGVAARLLGRVPAIEEFLCWVVVYRLGFTIALYFMADVFHAPASPLQEVTRAIPAAGRNVAA
jgi:hypothetical protein